MCVLIAGCVGCWWVVVLMGECPCWWVDVMVDACVCRCCIWWPHVVRSDCSGWMEYWSPSCCEFCSNTHTHTFNGPSSGTTRVSRYQKGKTSLDFTGARDSEWQWHQLGHMQVCTSLQTDNHASTPPLSFYWPDALPAARPTTSKHWRPQYCGLQYCGLLFQYLSAILWNLLFTSLLCTLSGLFDMCKCLFQMMIIIITTTMFMLLSSWPKSLREFTRFIWWM